MPPIILGLILGGTVEENLRRTLVLSDGSFSISSLSHRPSTAGSLSHSLPLSLS